MKDFKETIAFIRELYGVEKDFIPLHAPVFAGNEKKYLEECIDTTFVSSVGKFVDTFEEKMKEYTGAKYAVAVVNGTAALHMSLILAGVKQGDLVLTQALSFIATCNAISYTGADPAFIDVDRQRMGMSAEGLRAFLDNVVLVEGIAIHQPSGKKVAACVPMHTFGFPLEIDRIVDLCGQYNIPVIEDAAESLGSLYKEQHTGTFGLLGTFSFNGNKTITSGGGGIIVTNNDELGKLAKHLTTQAKVPHRWAYVHNQIGYNYRCPNLNAAVACAQLEQLDGFLKNKRSTAKKYESFFEGKSIEFMTEAEYCKANYWLNTIVLDNKDDRDLFLSKTNEAGIMTRPVWELMHRLPMFRQCLTVGLENSEWLADRLVNIPSSVIM